MTERLGPISQPIKRPTPPPGTRKRWFLRFERKPQDCWIGMFWKRDWFMFSLWVCIVPMLPVHVGWRLETPFPSPPATPECPDETTCLHCGEPIWWNEYSYIHAGGNADCVALFNRTGEWHTARPIEWADR